MLKNIISLLGNTILFYADKEGNDVFKNYNLFENTGYLYRDLGLSKIEVGKTLEYRFDLDKYLRIAYFAVPIFLYLILVHLKPTFFNFLGFGFLWIVLIMACRFYCAKLYSDHLVKNFGKYEITRFKPPVSKKQKAQFRTNFYSKLILVVIILAIFFIPAFLLEYSMKLCLSAKKPNFNNMLKISKVYSFFYPKNESFYDMRAYAQYANRDYEASLQDYKTVLSMSGRKFSKKDYTRFANLLYLEKKLNSPEIAVEVFNDYVTRKKMSVLQESQMVWVKSIFSVENNMPEMIIQDYNDLLASLNKKDTRNQFYITCDKAYVLYLMREYELAIDMYNLAIAYAEANAKQFGNDLKALYVERGYAKKQSGDELGAEADFVASGIDFMEIDKYEPHYAAQEFVIGY
ncbi:hypothetical protein HDR58_08895 [bacterium]|nr:hypothetical protein [bacterium]